MTESTINLSTDNATVKSVVNQIKSDMRGRGKYGAYVAEFGVTRETVKDHALALAALVYPKDEPVQKSNGTRTRFGNAVQAAGNGLRSALDKEESDGETVVNLLTRAGLKAELADVIAAWEAAQENN